jgi:hypothetical protein
MCFGVVENIHKIFNNKSRQFPETKVPHHKALQQLVLKFKESVFVCDATRSGRPPILTEKTVLDISDGMLQSPKKSIRTLLQQVGFSYGTTHTSLKKCLHLLTYLLHGAESFLRS